MTETNGASVAGLEPAAVGEEVRIGRVWRENVETKARRLLIEGRLTIRRADAHGLSAVCRGTETLHELGFDKGSYWCSCAARGRCSHIAALQLVTLRP